MAEKENELNAEQIAKLKELAQAMPSAPFGYSFGTGYVARKTENSYFHVAQAPSGMSSTMEWERSASFIAALLEAAPELIALAERTTAPVDENSPLFDLLKRAIGVIALHDEHEAKTIAADARALLAAAPAPIQQVPTAWCTDAHFEAWCERHDMRKDRGDHREMFDDAASLYLTVPATPPALAGSQVQDGD